MKLARGYLLRNLHLCISGQPLHAPRSDSRPARCRTILLPYDSKEQSWPAKFALSFATLYRLLPVSALSVDPSAIGRRPTGSQTGRQLCQVVGPAVRQLDWGMNVVEGVEGRAFRTQDVEHRSPNVFIVLASLSFRPS